MRRATDPRRRSRSGRAWSRIAVGLALVAAALVAGPGLSRHARTTSMALRGEAPVAAQVRAAERMADLAGRIAGPWGDRRDTRSGLFVDPITGGAPAGDGGAFRLSPGERGRPTAAGLVELLVDVGSDAFTRDARIGTTVCSSVPLTMRRRSSSPSRVRFATTSTRVRVAVSLRRASDAASRSRLRRSGPFVATARPRCT